jgi:hypothetical protein
MLPTNDGTVRSNIVKNAHFCAAAAYSARLRRRNRTSREPVTGDGPVNVSLTSYGRRLKTVWVAIESIGLGIMKPGRIILWLDDEETAENPPAPLRRLQNRGLEIRHSRNYGPHTKYFPYVSQLLAHQPNVPLVTADDDVLYPPTWLSELMAAHQDGQVTAWRARIRTDGPYRDWPLYDTTNAPPPPERMFATGVSGVAYPARVLEALRDRGEEFMRACPRADDFWLHYATVAAGVPVRQVRNAPAEWWSVPSTIFGGLRFDNLTANDEIHRPARTAWTAPRLGY